MSTIEDLAQRFDADRPHLRSVAFHLLGSGARNRRAEHPLAGPDQLEWVAGATSAGADSAVIALPEQPVFTKTHSR